MRIFTRFGLALVVALAVTACDSADDDGPATTSDAVAAPAVTTEPASTTEPDDGPVPGSVAPTVPSTRPAGGDSSGGPGPTQATDDGAATTIAIETDDGTLTVGGDVAEAAALAPVPPDATIDLVTTAENVTTVVASSPSSIDELTEFYLAAVRAAGDEPTDAALGDTARRIAGMTSFGAMSTVLAGGPGGSVVITVEITS